MHRVRLNGAVSYCFGTLLFAATVPGHADISPALAALLRGLRDADPARSRTAVDGWQSRPLDAGAVPALAALGGHVRGAVEALTAAYFEGTRDLRGASVRIAEMWGNVYGPGDFAAPHRHGGAHWSGIYVVDAGDPQPPGSRSGFIRLDCPPGTALPNDGLGEYRKVRRNVEVAGADGLLLVFPSPQVHFAHPYLGLGERITVAFNCVVDFPAPPG